jgi:AraC-like DNA-binding protein
MACITAPVVSVRRYSGEHTAHAHEHAQVLYALQGRMELEVGGRAAFVDTACGMVIPAGVAHGLLAQPGTSVFVIDAPAQAGTDRPRRFAVPARWPDAADAASRLGHILQAPRVLARRAVAPAALERAVCAALHEDWPTARLAALCALSAPRFHARWLELTGLTPQAWLRARRLDAAERALARGQPLEITAMQVGYASASALAYALRRERGTGARALRNSCKVTC